MANTYVAIATVTVGAGGASSIDFTSIPGTYTDLKVLLSVRTNRNATDDDLKILVNGSSASVYSNQRLYGNGSSVGGDGLGSTSVPYAGAGTGNTATASTFGNCELYFTEYTSSNTKSMLADAVAENNAFASFETFSAWRWNPATQAAITSIAITPYNGTSFAQYSTATLYGIKNS